MPGKLRQVNIRFREAQVKKINKLASLLKRSSKGGDGKSGWRDEIVRRAIDAYNPLKANQ